MQSRHISIPGPPEIVPVRDFRGITGIGFRHMIAGRDPRSKPKQSAAFQRVRARSNAR